MCSIPVSTPGRTKIEPVYGRSGYEHVACEIFLGSLLPFIFYRSHLIVFIINFCLCPCLKVS